MTSLLYVYLLVNRAGKKPDENRLISGSDPTL